MSDEEAAADVGGANDGASGGEDGNRDFTEVSHESYCDKMGKALTGVCFGFLLFFGSIGLLIYNEGRTVKRAKDIDEGMEVVVELDLSLYTNGSMIPTETFANKLIHAVGDLNTVDTMMDPIFGVGSGSTTDAMDRPLKLSRAVEMYQWVESSTSRKVKTAGGGTRTETTYRYNEEWSSTLISSSAFRDAPSDAINPTQFPFEDLDLVADPIKLGGITLSDDVVDRLNWFEPVDSVSLENVVDQSLVNRLDVFQQNGFYYHDSTNYTKTNSTSNTNQKPVVGDTRIRFDQVPPDTISIIALFRSEDVSVGTYTTTRGGALLLVKRGTISAKELFQQADAENTTLAWILRFVGFFLMVVSILLVLQPLATAVDIIPFVGDFLQGGLEGCLFPVIAILIALPISLFTVALAWLAYHPMWSVPMLVVSSGIIAWLYCRAKKAKQDADEMGESDDNKPTNHDNVNATSPDYQYGSTTTGDNNYTSNYGNNDSNYNGSYQTTGGFASALDQPPPSSTSPAIPIVEPDVVMGQPYQPAEAEANKPFVPQVYKP